MAMWMLQWIGVLYGVFLGGCLASFGCVVSERVPAGLGIGGRSVCACGRQLTALENIPVLGWARVGGRARCCDARLPVRYLLWELGYAGWGAVLLGWAWHRWTAGTLDLVVVAVTVIGFVGFFALMLAVTWQRATPLRTDTDARS